MRIHMKALSINQLKENYFNDCVDCWYKSKSQCPNQQKRKKYKDRKANKEQRPNFKISDLDKDD